jgi:serine/threonine protein phosphatase PrpC
MFVVCDGLGGHSCGDLASKTAVETICSSLNENSDIENFVSLSLDNAQNELLRVQNETPTAKKMRTTAVVLFVDGKSFRCGHIGDSRLYLFGKNGEKTRTKDHSIPQILALTGEIGDDEIRFHPDRNLILKALGNEGTAANCEVGNVCNLDEYKAFLLCTDGFWEYITDEQIAAALASSDNADQWMNKMTKIITKNTKNKDADNRTAIAVINRD